MKCYCLRFDVMIFIILLIVTNLFVEHSNFKSSLVSIRSFLLRQWFCQLSSQEAKPARSRSFIIYARSKVYMILSLVQQQQQEKSFLSQNGPNGKPRGAFFRFPTGGGNAVQQLPCRQSANRYSELQDILPEGRVCGCRCEATISY